MEENHSSPDHSEMPKSNITFASIEDEKSVLVKEAFTAKPNEDEHMVE